MDAGNFAIQQNHKIHDNKNRIANEIASRYKFRNGLNANHVCLYDSKGSRNDTLLTAEVEINGQIFKDWIDKYEKLTEDVNDLKLEVNDLKLERIRNERVKNLRYLIEQGRQKLWQSFGEDYRNNYPDNIEEIISKKGQPSQFKPINWTSFVKCYCNDADINYILQGNSSQIYQLSGEIHKADKQSIAKSISQETNDQEEFKKLYYFVFNENI